MPERQVSEKKWSSVGENDYEDAKEFCSACLIDLNPRGEEKKKNLCKLPVTEPKKMGGRLNRNAVRSAASILAGARGGLDAPAAEKRKAARKLVRLYRKLGEDAPEAVKKLAEG